MSKQLSNRGISYQVIEQPKDNNFDFIYETGETGVKMNYGTRKIQRNATANQKIVLLTNVPFPPGLTEEDLIKPRNKNCDKRKVPNKFFIYRKWYAMCLEREGQKNDQTSISPYISEQWSKEPQDVKDYYHELSRRANKIQKNYENNTKKDGEPRNEELSHSSEQFEMENAYDYYLTNNNNMNHENNNIYNPNKFIYLNNYILCPSGFTDDTTVFEGQVNDSHLIF
ncbi:8725_t:CDS:2 [Diversispora eburnea]|uniref:8725_t:CDS:1 n=1 Tax=Diversispora eburnea TaxID=1213867 RepID=A0A9N9FPH1_9GLOM|nr:8725_t:CDS:2 [Diversispora eburnea]